MTHGEFLSSHTSVMASVDETWDNQQYSCILRGCPVRLYVFISVSSPDPGNVRFAHRCIASNYCHIWSLRESNNQRSQSTTGVVWISCCESWPLPDSWVLPSLCAPGVWVTI